MRIALVQLAMEGKSRAADIQHLARTMDRALRAAPPTDLVVLPGACDTGGGAVRDRHDEGALAELQETLAFQARDWGVHIVVGLHARQGEKLLPCAVLFDADGDVVARCFTGRFGAEGEASLPCRSTVFGDVGVYEPSSEPPMANGSPPGERGLFIGVPCSPVSSVSRRRTARFGRAVIEDPAVRGGAYWGFAAIAGGATAAGEAEGPATFVCAPDGTLLAAVDGAEETIIYVDVPLLTASPSVPAGM